MSRFPSTTGPQGGTRKGTAPLAGGLRLRRLPAGKAATMQLPYVQIGKLRQKTGGEIPENDSVPKSELSASCSFAELFKCHRSKDRQQETNNSPLPHPASTTGLYYEITKIPPYWPCVQQRAAKEGSLPHSSPLAASHPPQLLVQHFVSSQLPCCARESHRSPHRSLC